MINQIYQFLEKKKILILGYGREGKSTYNFIRRKFPNKGIGIYDKKVIMDKPENVKVYSGDAFDNILSDYDLIIKSPGIVLNNKDKDVLKKLTSQTEIYLRYYAMQTIGITGTKGKSTTSSLLNHILINAGKDVLLVGNIGVPVFDTLDKIKKETIVVYEMSSHQLEYSNYSPHIALLLNVYQDHLDHYEGYNEYILAKENIFRHQAKGDIYIYNKEFIRSGNEYNADTITISSKSSDADMVIKADNMLYNDKVIRVNEEELFLKGRHNIYNIAAAYVIADQFGITDEEFYEAVKTFKPLPHRLEFTAEVGGVKYYNDSISTICETTIQAVSSVKDVDTLILGGMDRGIDYEPLANFLISSEIRNIILMPDTGIRLNRILIDKGIKNKNIYLASGVEEAVKIAKGETKKGKTCLFSPAAASYGFFKNFEERGNVFKKCVLSG